MTHFRSFGIASVLECIESSPKSVVRLGWFSVLADRSSFFFCSLLGSVGRLPRAFLVSPYYDMTCQYSVI